MKHIQSFVRKSNRRRLIAGVATSIASVVAATAVSSPVQADNVPELYMVQGMLSDDGGVPIDGVHDVTLSLHAQSQGGTALYSESHEDLAVDHGHFLAYLGAGTPTADDLTSAVFEENQAVWLEVAVDGEVLRPRFQYGAVPFAAVAGKADVAARAEEADSATSCDRASTATTATNLAAGRPLSPSELTVSGTSTLASASVSGNLDVDGSVMLGIEVKKCPNTTSCSCPNGKSLLSGGASGGTDLAGIATHPVVSAQAENTTTFRALCKDAPTCAEITILCARIGD